MAAPEHFTSMVLLVSFVTSLCCPCSTQNDSCSVTIQVDPSSSNGNSGINASGSGVNQLHVYRITSLDTALEMVVNGSLHFQGANDTLCLHLSPGEHVLGYSQRVIVYDVVISGEGPQEVSIICASGGRFSESSYDEFPLMFGNGSRVTVRGVGFARCDRPLLFYETWNVTLEDCLFSSFTQSAVEIYNTPYVTVRNCSFTNNTSFGVGTIRNSGNGGALSIGFNETFPNTTKPQILIQDSKFERNNAIASANCTSVSAILSTKMYSQRGGGMACYFAATGVEVVIVVERCMFADNKAQDSGGGVYINLSGVNGSFANITFRESDFSGNNATHGGGIEVTFDTTDSVLLPNFLQVQDCNFSGNRAVYGGAMKPVQISSQGNLNRIHVMRSKFHKNYGKVAAMHLESFFSGLGRFTYMNSKQNTDRIDRLQSTDRIIVENCTFTENAGTYGVVFITYNQVNFTGKNDFRRNSGSAIRVAGSLLSFSGQLQFIGNKQSDDGPSGTLYVTSFAQILLNPGVRVSFINNTGIEGGAIVVKSSRISSGFARTLYNPQCFLQFTNPKVAPTKWADYNVSLHFQGNCALLAPVLYISSLDACSWFDNSGNFFNINITETWSFMSVMENYDMCGGERTNHPELYIQTELKDIRIDRSFPSSRCDSEGVGNSTDVCAYPGQLIRLNVTPLDQYSHTTLGFLQITTQDTNIEFSPTIVLAGAESHSIDFRYKSNQTFESTTVALNSSFSVTDVSETFTLRHIGCPPGFRLSSDSYRCECETRAEVLLCDVDKEFILLDDGLWGAPPTWSRSLVTYPCPATYCSCSGSPTDNTTEGCALRFTESYFPCKLHRTGVLCGECQPPTGVGMLNMNCRMFGASFPMYYWLLPLLVLFDVIVVVVVVKVGVSLPALLLGFLYYVQISPTAMNQVSDSFMLFPGLMGCIASALALYVPYDFSLHVQLTALESYGLRYITPLLTLLVAPIAIRIKYHTRSWHGVWTLLLLMYGMAVETSASLLFCPTFTRSNNGTSETITVWFFDGSVTCYSGAQLGLFIVAILVLIIGVLAIFAVAVMAYQKEISKWKKFSFLDRRRFETISLAFTLPYKDDCRWWAPFELLRRYAFLIAVIFNPGYLTIALSLASVILAIQWFIQPYKDHITNLIEAFCLTVLVTLLCLGDSNNLITLATGISNFTLWPVFYLPVVVGFVCLCAIVVKGIWKVSTYFKAWLDKRIMRKKEEQLYTTSEPFLDRRAYSSLRSKTSTIVPTVVSIESESLDL